MKKLMIASLLALLCAPAFAEGPRDCKGDNCPMRKDGKAAAATPGKQKMNKDARAEEFKKARKAHKAKMRATEEKVEKLVAEYNKLKPGKKKDAKKAEIAAVVASIRDEQIKFKEEQLGKFKMRLERMKQGLDKQSSAEAKKAWVDAKTDALIADEGDLDVLFEPDMAPRPHKMGSGPKGGPMMDGGPGVPPGSPMGVMEDLASPEMDERTD